MRQVSRHSVAIVLACISTPAQAHGPVSELAPVRGSHVEPVSDGGELALLASGGHHLGSIVRGEPLPAKDWESAAPR